MFTASTQPDKTLWDGITAPAGASFGSGASNTVFGSAGSGNVLTRATAILATLFFIGSIGLAVLAKHKAEIARSGKIDIPAAVEARDVPAAPDKKAAQDVHDVPSVATKPTDAAAVAGAKPEPADVPAAPPAK